MPESTCPYCGNPRSPHQSAITCGSADCKRQQHNKRMREYLRARYVPRAAAPFDCVACGERCVPGENVGPRATRFCGKQCKRRWHSPLQTARARLPERVKDARKKLRAAQRGAGSSRQWVVGACQSPGCEATFCAPRAASQVAHYCSEMCARRVQRKRHRAKHGRIDIARKRARYFGVQYEPVNHRQVFERDGYRCHICRRLTLRTALVPNPRAPTLDHIIPMSRGGPHTYENVSCACFKCNTAKGNRGGGEQLMLVG